MDHDAALLLCTVPDEATAKSIARGLVEARLAACVSILPGVTSIYRWNDAIEEGQELQLVIKTTRFRAQAAMDHVRSVHPFEVPELIVLSVTDGAEAYLSWIERETTPG